MSNRRSTSPPAISGQALDPGPSEAPARSTIDARDTVPEPAPGLVWAFRFGPDGMAEELSECAMPRAARGGASDGSWLWMHFNLADVRAVNYLRRHAGLFPPTALELLLSSSDRQFLKSDGPCIYGVFADLVYRLNGLTDDMGLVHFAATDGLIVTGRREGLNALESVRRSLRSGKTIGTPLALLERMLDKVASGVERRAEALADELDTIEERLTVEVSDDHPARLARVRRLAVRLHRLLSTQRSMIGRFEQKALRQSGKGASLRTSELAQRLDWLDHEMIALRDRAHLLQEEVSLRMTDETNRNLQLLTIVTTVFLPASLISSIFGMNVGGLPLEEDRGGFTWSIVLLVAASGVVFWILKRMGLLRR